MAIAAAFMMMGAFFMDGLYVGLVGRNRAKKE